MVGFEVIRILRKYLNVIFSGVTNILGRGGVRICFIVCVAVVIPYWSWLSQDLEVSMFLMISARDHRNNSILTLISCRVLGKCLILGKVGAASCSRKLFVEVRRLPAWTVFSDVWFYLSVSEPRLVLPSQPRIGCLNKSRRLWLAH